MVLFKNKQSLLSFSLAYMLSFPAINYAINGLFEHYIGSFSLDSMLLFGLYYFLLGLCLWHFYKNIPLPAIIVLGFFAGAFILTAGIFPQNIERMWTSATDIFQNPTYIMILNLLSGFFLSFHLTDFDTFTKLFEKISVFTIMVSVINFYVNMYAADYTLQYMTFSYHILLSTTFLTLLCFNKFTWSRFIFAAIGIVMIFLYGSRGAFFSIFIIALPYPFIHGKYKSHTKIIAFVLALLLCIIVFLNSNTITTYLLEVSEKYNIESRTLEYALEGKILDDSGRSSIQEYLLSRLSLFGYGVYGDRILANGFYAHNIFIEIFVHYGIIFGIVLTCILVSIILAGLFRTSRTKSVVTFTLLSAGFLKLLFSGSYLNQEPAFYALLGLCVSTLSKQKKVVETKKSKYLK